MNNERYLIWNEPASKLRKKKKKKTIQTLNIYQFF